MKRVSTPLRVTVSPALKACAAAVLMVATFAVSERLDTVAYERVRVRVEELVKSGQFSQAREMVTTEQATEAGQGVPELYGRLLKWVSDSERQRAAGVTTENFNVLARRIDAFVKANQFGEAREAIATMRQKPDAGLAPEQYDRLLATVAENEEWTELRALARDAKWSEFIERADKFVVAYPRSRFAPAAKLMTENARRSTR